MLLGLLSRRRISAAVCVRITTLIFSVLFVSAWGVVSPARDQDVGVTTADQLLDEACRAKADGSPGVAYALLHQVVRIAPDNSLARWQLGQVNVDNEWLSIEESQRR